MKKVPVVVPSLGNEISEAQIDQWLVAEGDSVNEGDQILLLTTPKVVMEIEAPVSGVLRSITALADDIVEEGSVLGAIETMQDNEQ